MSSTASAPASLSSRTCSSVEKKPFASSGASVTARAARRSSTVPANFSSTSTEIAFAPFAGTERSAVGTPDVEALAVREAIRSISADQAVALVLHYAHGFTRAEIAELVGRTEETVKSRIARGRRAFLAAYDRQGGTP